VEDETSIVITSPLAEKWTNQRKLSTALAPQDREEYASSATTNSSTYILPLWKSRTVVNDAWHEHDKATAVLATFLRCGKYTMPCFEGMVAILTW
jgi:hypothetical protein